ncbi:MAG: hypothetical protein LBS84_00975, partial [Clostridiales bacterium]|nr:hypothetical protein [Clostridiales bacterium]
DEFNIWSYWAAPLKPGEATGLLLNKVNKIETAFNNNNGFLPFDKGYYYGINVQAQMATRDGTVDSNGVIDNYKRFGDEANGGWSYDAELLMEKIVNVTEDANIVTAEPVYILEDGATRIQLNMPLLNGVIYVRPWNGLFNSTDPGNQLQAVLITDTEYDRGEFTPAPGTNYSDYDVYHINNESASGIWITFSPSDNGSNVCPRHELSAAAISNASGKGPTITVPFVILPFESQSVVFGKSGKVYVDYGNSTYKELNDDGTLGSLITINEIV